MPCTTLVSGTHLLWRLKIGMMAQVLYLDLVKDDGHGRLIDLATALRSHFQDNGLSHCVNERPFTAHVTIAKLSNMIKGKWRSGPATIKSIPEVWRLYNFLGALHSSYSCFLFPTGKSFQDIEGILS